MRIKQELKLPKTPHNLWIDNKAIQELQDFFPVEEDRSNSPETCSHRHQQGWQHLQDLPVQNSLNNNNTISITTNNNNNNINNNPDEVVILASSSPHPIDGSSCEEDDVEDFQSHHSHEDDDDDDDDDSDETSSCDEDDSSISFSDTSPLLDVSSLDEDSSTSSEDSEDDDNDTDMCDEDEGIPESGDVDDNVDDGFEEEEDHGCSMDTSWMSISSAASVDLPSAPETRSQIFDHRRDRNGIVLPDVLPVSVSKASNEDFTPDGVKKIVDATLRELTLRVKKRSDLKLDPVPRLLSRDCCIVEITTQPDIQVDIRLNSAPSAPGIMPISEAYVRHGGTYPPRSIAPPDPVIKNYNSSNKTISEDSTTESQALLSDSTQESRTAARYVGLGEGIRLNNFSIVNGFKAVSLTELVKTDDDESIPPGSPRKIEMTNHASSQESSSSHSVKIEEVSNSPILPEKFPNHPAGGFNIYSKENRRHYKDYTSLQQRPCLDLSKPRSTVSSQDSKSGAADSFLKNSEIVSNQCINANVLHSQSKKAPQITKRNDVSAQLPKETDEKLSSPELFEVYTLETAVPHVNWTAINRINRESEWLKKRRNDREEIRRKLAMDSDNEDYVAEKLVQSQENGTIDRLKGGNNLQICFMNEAAKATETIVEAEPPVESIEPSTEKVRKPLPKILMPNLLFPPSLQRSPGSSKPQNNNNTQTQVVKRQRPTFFFNRPRSWHAAKVEEKQDPEEDLFTRHHRLQAEAREALTQAKDMARMQMEIERQKKKKSPIADIVGISFPDGQNSLSRHALLDMNVAQLQVIVNDLHSQIETLNENLVKFLLERDDLHMEQDSMLVDIEDLTRYLGLKGGSSVSHSMDSKLPLNVQVSSNNKKSLI